MYNVDLSQARALLAQAVEVKGPEHIETSCKYVLFADEDGDSIPPAYGCILGTAVASIIGLPALADIIVKAENGEDSINTEFASSALPKFGIIATPEALTYMRRAQDAQDGNHDGENNTKATWAEAVAYAESFL